MSHIYLVGDAPRSCPDLFSLVWMCSPAQDQILSEACCFVVLSLDFYEFPLFLANLPDYDHSVMSSRGDESSTALLPHS